MAAVSEAGGEAVVRSRLWDLPVRITHWALAALVGLAWFTAENHLMEWHRRCGYAILALLVFRLFWGFAGSSPARFASFVKGPMVTLAYVRTLAARKPSHAVGHNPLGALSVVALLAALVAQVVFGLFAVDVDGLESGPLSVHVSFDTGREFADWHETTFTVIQALVLLHLAAIAFYLVYKRDNLIGPMVTGWRRFAVDPQVRAAPAWRALLGLALALAVAWWVSRGLKPPL